MFKAIRTAFKKDAVVDPLTAETSRVLQENQVAAKNLKEVLCKVFDSGHAPCSLILKQ